MESYKKDLELEQQTHKQLEMCVYPRLRYDSVGYACNTWIFDKNEQHKDKDVFLTMQDGKRFSIDIEPEANGIKKGDYLSIDIPYKKGRLVIGNPPYGEKLKLATDFYNKSVDIADYIAFVLPISQLNNTSSLYKFDLIYSEDLGETTYSGRNPHCCFNIYERPLRGINETEKKHIDGIVFYRQDKQGYESIKDYDIRMCHWGNGTVGKILTNDNEHYSGECKIKITHPRKNEIIEFFNTFDWKEYTKGIAMKRLKQYQIINALVDNIDGLEEKPKSLF